MSTSAPAQEEKRTDSQESLSWKPDGLIGRGRFKLVRFIAQGGMGIVWEAFDTKLKERVAVKTVPAELRSNFPAFDHLRREIVRNRALSHPNIVRIHDLYEEEGEEPFILMELVDGRGLNEWQAEQDDGVFDWEWFKPFLLQICDALAYAHQRNIVHRDLKPANVLLGADGQIKIIDFGLATHFTDALHPMSRSLGASGTTAYMSPQQVEGWPSTAQDDIYALGATLFELLTGQPPFVGGDLAHQVAHHPPPKLQERIEQLGLNRTISGEAELFVGSCLIKDTAVRPKTVEALSGLIVRQSSEPATGPITRSVDLAQEEANAISPAQLRHSNFSIKAGAAIFCLALLTLGAAFWWQRSKNGVGAPKQKPSESSVIEQVALAETGFFPTWSPENPLLNDVQYKTSFEITPAWPTDSQGRPVTTIRVWRELKFGDPNPTGRFLLASGGDWSTTGDELVVRMDGTTAEVNIRVASVRPSFHLVRFKASVSDADLIVGSRRVSYYKRLPNHLLVSMADGGAKNRLVNTEFSVSGRQKWSATSQTWEPAPDVRAGAQNGSDWRHGGAQNALATPWERLGHAWSLLASGTGEGRFDPFPNGWNEVVFAANSKREGWSSVWINKPVNLGPTAEAGPSIPVPADQVLVVDRDVPYMRIERTGAAPAVVRFKDLVF